MGRQCLLQGAIRHSNDIDRCMRLHQDLATSAVKSVSLAYATGGLTTMPNYCILPPTLRQSICSLYAGLIDSAGQRTAWLITLPMFRSRVLGGSAVVVLFLLMLVNVGQQLTAPGPLGRGRSLFEKADNLFPH